MLGQDSGLYYLCALIIGCCRAVAIIVEPRADNVSISAMSSNGTVAPILAARLNLDYFDESNITLNKRDGSVDQWLTNISMIALADASPLGSQGALVKRTHAEGSPWWLVEAGQCAFGFWDIVEGVWQAGYDIYRMASSGNRGVVVMDSHGPFYYKYYAIDGNCASTIHQKTIAGALQAAARQLEGSQLCNNYLFQIDHHGSWKGDIIIGSSPSVYFTNVRWTTYKGWVDAGCEELQSPYNCNSNEQGN
ncbi:Css2p LALA0_S15e00254g [Lachancea lanzarotensis]|uniref:LALA0S15e00254g1_1 n=1 Tax=Lachancea lanzarotensis TaxID=1245769 RepID=A0A0C7NAQ5_9SACH|nr:uncharacterized protein LALA0_S15e00254g [Lachancea lanzarotensis]CEP64914.1 LALA0S15e00254g1_1 [Lachancea lanzarotensis]